MRGRVYAVHAEGFGGRVGGLIEGCGRDGRLGQASDEAGDGVGDGEREVGGCGVWLWSWLRGRGGRIWSEGTAGFSGGRHTVELSFLDAPTARKRSFLSLIREAIGIAYSSVWLGIIRWFPIP